MKRSAVLCELLFLAAFLVLTLLMTWPWVLHLHDATNDRLDSYAHAYFLWWGYHQTLHDPLNLFQSTIFYPYPDTFAFGENDYGISLILFPLFALGLRPLTVHGIATLLGIALSGYGMFRLARTLTGSYLSACVAGIVFAFIPYRFGQLDRLPLLFAVWIPLLLEALVLFARERSWRRAAWLGFAFIMNALTCLTWFVLTLLPLALSGILLITQHRLWRERNFWLRAGAGLSAAALLLLPFLLPFYRVSKAYGFVRDAAEVASYSARPINWLAADWHNKLWRGLGASAHATSELSLFPGLLAPLLALAALLLINPASSQEQTSRKHVSHLAAFLKSSRFEPFGHGLIWTITGFLGSFGMNFIFHRMLYEFVPLFRSMRVVARWSMICYVGLALLAGLGAHRLAEVLARHWPNPRKALTCAVIILALLFEMRVAPLDLIRGEADPDALTLRLRQTKMRGGIVDLPAGQSGTGNQRYMLRAADHERPIVVATNSFAPPFQREIESLTRTQPIPDRFLDLLETIPASYLVIHQAFLSPRKRLAIEELLARGVAAGRLRFIQRYGYTQADGFSGYNDLYAITRTEPEAKSETAPPPLVSYENYLTHWQNLPPGFQDSGYFIYRLYKVSFGRAPHFDEFKIDAAAVKNNSAASTQRLQPATEQLFIQNWTNRSDFKTRYDEKTAEQYVDELLANSGIKLEQPERTALVQSLKDKTEGRAAVLQKIVDNERFLLQEFEAGYVLMNYFAYLEREPDEGGYDFWLDKLNDSAEYSNISKAFISSPEHQSKAARK